MVLPLSTLISALNGAFPFAEIENRAVLTENLDFDVTRLGDEFSMKIRSSPKDAFASLR